MPSVPTKKQLSKPALVNDSLRTSNESSWLVSRGMPSVGSLFSGCGGLDLGAELAGCGIIFGNDIDRDSAKSFGNSFQSAKMFAGSVRDISKFPKVDILTGGYPCQSFSMGGLREPSSDSRSLLYREFVRAIEAIQPKVFVAENVIGLLSLDGGIHFRRQIRALASANPRYRISWARLDAHRYGLPQRRSRVLIVGIRRDLGAKFVFPEATHGPGLLNYVSHGDAISAMPLWPDGEFYHRPKGGDDNFPWYYMSRNRKAKWIEPSYTVVANWRHVSLHPASPTMKLTWSNLKDGWKQRWDFSDEYEHLELSQQLPFLEVPRRLSWRECAVLQGFPRVYEPAGSVESKYRQVGNAVPPPLARMVFERIISGSGVVQCR